MIIIPLSIFKGLNEIRHEYEAQVEEGYVTQTGIKTIFIYSLTKTSN